MTTATSATSAARRYRTAVVGLGAMGLRHARVFAKLAERFEIVGGYDVRPEAPTPEGAPRLRCEEEAIEAAEVLVVATSTPAHGAVVARALSAGRHVLVEKPLCATAVEASAVAGLSARGGALLFVGHSERFNPVVRALVRLLRGEPLLAIDLVRVGPTRPADGGVLVNLGVHDFDLAAYLGGAPISLRAAVGKNLSGGTPGDGGDDFAHVVFTTGSGAAGHIHVDRTAPTKRRQIALVTPRWLYEGDLLAHRLVRTSRGTGARTDVPLPLGEPLALQALALADALDARFGSESEGGSGAAGAGAGGRGGGLPVHTSGGGAPLHHTSAVARRSDASAARVPHASPSSQASNGTCSRDIATGADGAEAVDLAERAAKMAVLNGVGSVVGYDPFESPAREKLVAAKAPLLPKK